MVWIGNRGVRAWLRDHVGSELSAGLQQVDGGAQFVQLSTGLSVWPEASSVGPIELRPGIGLDAGVHLTRSMPAGHPMESVFVPAFLPVPVSDIRVGLTLSLAIGSRRQPSSRLSRIGWQGSLQGQMASLSPVFTQDHFLYSGVQMSAGGTLTGDTHRYGLAAQAGLGAFDTPVPTRYDNPQFAVDNETVHLSYRHAGLKVSKNGPLAAVLVGLLVAAKQGSEPLLAAYLEAQ